MMDKQEVCGFEAHSAWWQKITQQNINLNKVKGSPYVFHYCLSIVLSFNHFHYDQLFSRYKSILKQGHQITKKITLDTIKSKHPIDVSQY